MSQTTINTTDSIETGRVAINANFTEIYAGAGGKSLLVFGGVVGPSITRYVPLGSGDSTARTNEYEAQVPVGAGVIKNLRVWICSNAGVNNYVVTVRKNGSDQTLTVSCNTNTTTGTLNSDTTHSFTTASGDLISVKVVTGANTAFTPAYVYYSMEFIGG